MEGFAGSLGQKAGEKKRGLRLRPIALPAEHGGWSFTLEPVILGLMVRPSAAGAALALGMLALFLARQPLRLAGRDWISGRATPRRRLATAFAAFYLSAGIAAIGVAALWSTSAALVPLLLASPFFLAQVIIDLRPSRETLLSEFVTPAALSSAAASIALAGGGSISVAVSLWLICTARFLPTVLYVRARLRRERGRTGSGGAAIAAHAAVVTLSVPMVANGFAPLSAIIAFALLLFRAAWGLSGTRKTAARSIGFSEVAWGILTILLIGFGFRLDL